MSVEIYGSNPDNAELVTSIGAEVARLLEETGVQASLAHTLGVRAAEYGASLLISTQEMCGEVSPGNCSDEHFISRLRAIGSVSTNPELEDELFPGGLE